MYSDESSLGNPVAVVGPAIGAVKGAVGGITDVFHSIFGGGGPAYQDAVKRVAEAKAKALAGDMTGGRYMGLTVTVDPVTYLWQLSTSSSYPQARAAALQALQVVAMTGPSAAKSSASNYLQLSGVRTTSAGGGGVLSGSLGSLTSSPLPLIAAGLVGLYFISKRKR